jgi:hypothetical protein
MFFAVDKEGCLHSLKIYREPLVFFITDAKQKHSVSPSPCAAAAAAPNGTRTQEEEQNCSMMHQHFGL